MNNKDTFYLTLIISVIVQAITGFVEIFSLFIKVPNAFNVIRQLMIMEVSVQVVEGLFYVWLLYNFNKVINVTPKRYIDWAITTPTMLVTLISYLIYLHHREKDTTSQLSLYSILSDNFMTVSFVLILNWLMLLFGYLGEVNIIPTVLGVFLGFIPFMIYYYIIYTNYVTQILSGSSLYWYFFIFWSLYGVVALLPYYIKNSFYNIIDLFSKNFFGIFLSYIIISGNY